MALAQLSDEQVHAWTTEQKDQWWATEVYRGDVPQLTIRSALTGFLLGGILSATNLYIGAKTGLTLGVGVTSVILAFAVFRAMARAGLAHDFSVLENNAMQSIATAAGYMTSPLISSLAAYMLVTGTLVPWWQMVLWNVVASLLGVVIAFPMKRRFINADQLPFPEGRASAVVLDALHTTDATSGVYKAKVLAVAAAIAGGFQLLASEGWMRLVQLRLLRLDRWTGLQHAWTIRERVDEYYYLAATRLHLWIPRILGTDVRELGLRVAIDFSVFGVGGLIGMRTAVSVLLGGVLNLAVLAPVMVQRGDIVRKIGATGGLLPLSRIEIVNQWALWWAVAMMVVGSLVALLGKPRMILDALRLDRKGGRSAVLRHVELPLWISVVSVPILGVVAAWMSHSFFGARWALALGSLPLIFVLALIGSHSMAMTSWTPTGAMAKITQFSVGAFDRTNPGSNLSAAGMTAEVASNASNLLSDIKAGYMLGAKPRQQAVGHVIGILSGALASTPLFYVLFLPSTPGGAPSIAGLVTDRFPFPAALQWKGVAEIIGRGLQSLPTSALVAMGVATVAAAAMEIARIARRGRFPLSPVAIGLGAVLPFDASLAMFAGALFFELMSRRHRADPPESPGRRLWVESVDPICAGLMSGAALIGIGNAILVVLLA